MGETEIKDNDYDEDDEKAADAGGVKVNGVILLKRTAEGGLKEASRDSARVNRGRRGEGGILLFCIRL
ncbi:hypothetical protein L1987_39992 [Smallanthus sonchifolius]|uniref:Uncharacterized protein n=1 Tax=Smallanthus sonchifolius TaxID=185202 RepID=A0ACB9GTF4_9ASTR|nr:hypothetical protein L1987_39992 [Smallanthus sonchifolius]